MNELSGEQAYLHVQMLSANRDRQAAEYQGAFFETTYLRDRANEYGLSDVTTDFFPTPGRETWDGEEGDLWLVEPVRRKLASLNQVPTSLASGSTDVDVETELVYVGAGRETDFQGKDVKGKVVLGSGSVGTAFQAGVVQRGAIGALGTGSAGVNADSAGYTLDQVGWSSVPARPDRPGFGFSLSLRQFLELRGYFERGQKVVVRAHVRAKSYPAKMNVVSASIPGSDPAAGELMLVAHAFETISTPGANDNCTGVGTILEVGRTLARLVRDGALPRPKRTIRFIWANEISGTTAYMFKHPELQDTLLAALNFDMTGADTKKTDTYLRMKTTPDARPSYLNDLVANLLQYVDQTEIRTMQGDNGQFNYRLAYLPTITSGSDHSVFLAAGVPAMQFNYWPDNFYHSSEDRIVYVNPTELKRVGFTAAASFAYLADAGPAEAQDLAWEAAASGEKWMAEVTRQSARLLGNDRRAIHEQYKAAQTKLTGAFNRAKGTVESVTALSKEAPVVARVAALVRTLERSRDANAMRLEAAYAERCATLGLKPTPITALTPAEVEASLLVPKRKFKVYSAEAQKLQASRASGGRPAPGAPPAQVAPSAPRRRDFVSTSTSYFIDGRRTILDIYNGVRAECGNLLVGDNASKFQYVIGPEYPDVDLETVVGEIRALERNGVVEIAKLTPPPQGKAAGKKVTKSGKD